MPPRFEQLPLSKLKGVNVYCENDLHDLAALMLRLYDAMAAYDERNPKARPTVNGLVATFVRMTHPNYQERDLALEVVKKHGLPLGATIEYDEDVIH